MDVFTLSAAVVVVSLLYGTIVAYRQALRGDRKYGRSYTIPMLAGTIRRGERSRWHRPRRRERSAAQAPPRRSYRRLVIRLVLLAIIAVIGWTMFAPDVSGVGQVATQSADAVELAIQLPLTNEGVSFGQATFEGIQLAIEEANASGDGPQFIYTIYDDQGSDELAQDLAGQIVASRAMVVLGPAFSTTSLVTGPTYATASMASLPPTATSDLITNNPTTFRVVFKNSDQGELLAHYLVRVLGQRQAAVIAIDNGYGNTLREGFTRAAETLNIDAEYYSFANEKSAEAVARQIAQKPERRPIVLLSLDTEGVWLLLALKRLGVDGPFLGGDSFGDAGFSDLLANEPEEQNQPGFFTNNLYALAPVFADSAGADVIAFSERYRARFGKDPVWMSVAGYDAGSLAIAAARSVVKDPSASRDIPEQRAAVTRYLLNLAAPEEALPGLLGPIWFDATRARQQAIRVGHFVDGRLESAPVQIVTVPAPDPAEIATGAVFELAPGRYARLQRVVYTGIFLNQLEHINVSEASFNADFYLWMRFARAPQPESADPTNLIFPNMISGIFARGEPVKQRVTSDGIEYWLWRVQGEFRNDFDMRRFPFDQQALTVSFFNAHADASQVVYVIDKRTGAYSGEPDRPETPGSPAPTDEGGGNRVNIASPQAFLNLSEWNAIGAASRRENLLAESTLGDPAITSSNTQLELSGFLVTIDIKRHTLSTLLKTVLPLLFMSLIMLSSLFFPVSLVKEKVTVVIMAALAGAVLLTSINSQLKGVGYTVTIEYAFYVFFALALLSIGTVLSAERLRLAAHPLGALWLERSAQVVFALTVIATVAVMTILVWR